MKVSSRTKPFADYHEDSVRRILALGVSASQIEALRPFGLLAPDNVTGFHEGRNGSARVSTLLRAVRHVRETSQECYYVECDIRNLGGLNAALGHTGANEVFAAIAAVLRAGLSAVAANAVFFRHGGDEVSCVLIGANEQAVVEAFAGVRHEAAELARRFGVHEVPHPKHPRDPRFRGTGVRFGLVLLLPGDGDDLARVFRLADGDMKRRERHGQAGAS